MDILLNWGGYNCALKAPPMIPPTLRLLSIVCQVVTLRHIQSDVASFVQTGGWPLFAQAVRILCILVEYALPILSAPWSAHPLLTGIQSYTPDFVYTKLVHSWLYLDRRAASIRYHRPCRWYRIPATMVPERNHTLSKMYLSITHNLCILTSSWATVFQLSKRWLWT